MDGSTFQTFLAQIASRLRHDLKGGLITLKMGMESLPDEEALKPLLLEKTQDLVSLSDKLVSLLRMGVPALESLRPEAVFAQAAQRAEELFFPLRVKLESEGDLGRWNLDPDAVTLTVLELCENAKLAGATEIKMELGIQFRSGIVKLSDNGLGFPEREQIDIAELKEVGVSRWKRHGLGLAVVEQCLAAHGGSFTMQPLPQGALVELLFPLEVEA